LLTRAYDFAKSSINRAYRTYRAYMSNRSHS
jgi:hypothetical protein